MKLFKKNEKGFRYYCMAVMAMTFVLGTSVTAFAANDPIQVVNNLSDFIFGLVRAVGMIMLGFGIVQIGLSLKSHDPSQRANGFLTLAGGVVITFAKEILTLLIFGTGMQRKGGNGISRQRSCSAVSLLPTLWRVSRSDTPNIAGSFLLPENRRKFQDKKGKAYEEL